MPYNVPTWLMNWHFLAVPLPPEPVNIIIFALYTVAALALMAGVQRRTLYLFMAAVILYYCAREWLVACFHWVILPFCFLLALALDDSKSAKTPSRRLIQVAIVSCYLLGVLQKLTYPDFLQGYSFSSFFADGFAANDIFKPLFAALKMPIFAWATFSWMILVVETYLALGLCFARTRLATAIIGVLFHGGIMVTMEPIIGIFSLVMWTGYLAFFNKRPTAAAASANDTAALTNLSLSALNMVLCGSLIALMLLMPLRIYLPGGPANDVLTLFDRTPWTYGMFIMRQKVDGMSLAVTVSGETLYIKPTGWLLEGSTDNDLIAAANYAVKLYPQANLVKVQTIITVNQRRNVLKTLLWQKEVATVEPTITRTAQVIDDAKKTELIKDWQIK